MTEPRYPFVHVDVPTELADAMSEMLFELGAEGVEVRDATTLARGPVDVGAETLVTLVAAFATRESADRAVLSLDDELVPRVEEIVGDAWRDAWKEHFHPFALTPRIVVRPPWEPYEAKAGEHVLELEPGRAFGTGLHATTSLVARALDRDAAVLAGQTLLDVGTGSGILALVALVLGARRVIATDNDEDVIGVVRENAARNGLGDAVDASARALSEVPGTFPVVTANIEARVLVPLAPELAAKVAAGGLLILSGILAGQEDEVRSAYPELREAFLDREGEWVCLGLRRD